MNFSVRIKSSAAKELSRIDKPARDRLVDAIDQLAVYPLRGTVLKGDLRGWRRICVGDYRVVYEVQNQQPVVLLVRVRHR